MNYFSQVKSTEEAKQLYKKLALQHHPDRGGDVEIMKLINNEYEFIMAKLLKNSGATESEINDEINLSNLYKDALNSIIALENITIELVGAWLWVTGNTKQHKEILKGAGFYFASKKVAWYFRSEDKKCKSTKKLSLDEIKNKYGSNTISNTNKSYSLIN